MIAPVSSSAAATLDSSSSTSSLSVQHPAGTSSILLALKGLLQALHLGGELPLEPRADVGFENEADPRAELSNDLTGSAHNVHALVPRALDRGAPRVGPVGKPRVAHDPDGGAYVLGPPRGSGHADDAPIVLRGKALRDTFILRFLALERGIRGFLLVALAYGVWRFDGARGALKQVFDSYMPALLPLADRFGVDLDETGPVHLIQQAFTAKHSTLLLVALGVLAYGVLELVEAYGLWFKKRWGEYVAVVGTSVFVPLEIHEILAKVTWLRVGALIINLFAIAYLLWTKRLFGFRGGHAALLAERHNDSLLEVEQAASRAEP